VRRQRARESGHAAHSPELTAAVGLLAGVVLLGAWGGELVGALARALGEGFAMAGQSADGLGSAMDVVAIAGRFRRCAALVFVPLGSILFGTLIAVITAHQVQTGGLWAPARLAPDPRRLWLLGSGSEEEADLAGPLMGGLVTLLKLALLMAVAGGLLYAQVPSLARLARLEPPLLLAAASVLVRTVGLPLAVAAVALGLADFAWKFRRFEDYLRLTPDEQREEQKAVDGDPAVRSRRVQLARSWLRDPGELLAGAGLVVTGSAGLSVLLAGSPPPGRVTVRTIARGVAAASLRHAAEHAGVPVVRAPRLAQWFAASRVERSPLPPELATALAERWPRPANAQG
jgi:flagellar biosynthetic protein FlhB